MKDHDIFVWDELFFVIHVPRNIVESLLKIHRRNVSWQMVIWQFEPFVKSLVSQNCAYQTNTCKHLCVNVNMDFAIHSCVRGHQVSETFC